MLYTICKDDNPQNTVKKIKKIIENFGLKTEEIFYSYNKTDEEQDSPPLTSIRVQTVNYPIGGTNGKGTCVENAKASAYAEYMERLQNLGLGDLYELWTYSKDFKNASDIVFGGGNKFLNAFFDENVFKKSSKDYKKLEKCIFLPFYNINKEKTCELPHNVIVFEQGTNGMSAGNTLEEALVQGLSEVVERYSSKVILNEEIVLSSVPQEEYLKYENISKSIEFFKENGINVHIKDASLDGKIPVICTIFENKGIICPVFGAHPSLPIAIERTLTEFVQGRIYSQDLLTAIKEIHLPYFSIEKFNRSKIEDIYQSLTAAKTYFENNKFFDHIFFNENITEKFNKSAWIENKSGFNNKMLLKFLVEKVSSISEDIFVRDVSFLGFPSIYIYVPNVSEVKSISKNELKKGKLFTKWAVYDSNLKNKRGYTPSSLLNFADNYSSRIMQGNAELFNVPLEYIAFLCAILLKKTNKVKKYLNVLIAQNKVYEYFSDEQISVFNIISEYFYLSKKIKDETFIKKELQKRWKKVQIRQAIKVINELTFEEVLSMSIFKTSKKRKNLNKISKKLIKCLKEDVPEQIKLREHLSFLYEE